MIRTTSVQPVAEPIALNEAKLHLRVDSTADDETITALIRAARQWCEAYEGQSYMMREVKVYLDDLQSVCLTVFPLISVSSVQYVDTAGDTQTLSSSVYTVDTDSIPGRLYLAYNQSWPTTRDIPKAATITLRCGYATTFTAATNDTLTLGNGYFSNGDSVRVCVSTEDAAALPAPLAINTDYYVGDVSGVTCNLYTDSALTSGVDITDTGTGTFYIGFSGRGLVPDRVIHSMKLLLGHLYEHREENSEIALNRMPFGVKNLLLERVWI